MRFVSESFERVVVMANRKVIADGSAEQIFSDDTTLTQARLRRPEIAQLARDLNLSRSALKLADVLPLIP